MKNMYYFCRIFLTNIIMEIGQFLGFLVFLTVFTMGFWMLIFLLTTVVPYWLFGNLMESWKLKREAKKAKSK